MIGQLISAFLLSGAALKYGAAPERGMSAAILGMLLAANLYVWFLGRDASLQALEVGFLIIDLSVFVIMIVIALWANRMYTLWLAGFQILAMFAHLARSVTDAISPIAYGIMIIGPSYFQIIILGFGIWFHHRRVKRHGSYRSWRTSLPPSLEIPPRN